jgi:UDP-N-acetylglucosamine 2-epimerase
VFVGSLDNINNPYGSGDASKAIVAVLEKQTGRTSHRKVFRDLLHKPCITRSE